MFPFRPKMPMFGTKLAMKLHTKDFEEKKRQQQQQQQQQQQLNDENRKKSNREGLDTGVSDIDISKARKKKRNRKRGRNAASSAAESETSPAYASASSTFTAVAKRNQRICRLMHGGPVQMAIREDLILLRDAFDSDYKKKLDEFQLESASATANKASTFTTKSTSVNDTAKNKIPIHLSQGDIFQTFKRTFQRTKFAIIHMQCCPPRGDRESFIQLVYATTLGMLRDATKEINQQQALASNIAFADGRDDGATSSSDYHRKKGGLRSRGGGKRSALDALASLDDEEEDDDNDEAKIILSTSASVSSPGFEEDCSIHIPDVKICEAFFAVFALYTIYETNPLPSVPTSNEKNVSASSIKDPMIVKSALSTLSVGLITDEAGRKNYRRSYRAPIRIDMEHHALLYQVRAWALEVVNNCQHRWVETKINNDIRNKGARVSVSNQGVRDIDDSESDDGMEDNTSNLIASGGEEARSWVCKCGFAKDCIYVIDHLHSKASFQFCEYTGPVSLESLAGSPDYYHNIVLKEDSSKHVTTAKRVSSVKKVGLNDFTFNSKACDNGNDIWSSIDLPSLQSRQREYHDSIGKVGTRFARNNVNLRPSRQLQSIEKTTIGTILEKRKSHGEKISNVDNLAKQIEAIRDGRSIRGESVLLIDGSNTQSPTTDKSIRDDDQRAGITHSLANNAPTPQALPSLQLKCPSEFSTGIKFGIEMAVKDIQTAILAESRKHANTNFTTRRIDLNRNSNATTFDNWLVGDADGNDSDTKPNDEHFDSDILAKSDEETELGGISVASTNDRRDELQGLSALDQLLAYASTNSRIRTKRRRPVIVKRDRSLKSDQLDLNKERNDESINSDSMNNDDDSVLSADSLVSEKGKQALQRLFSVVLSKKCKLVAPQRKSSPRKSHISKERSSTKSRKKKDAFCPMTTGQVRNLSSHQQKDSDDLISLSTNGNQSVPGSGQLALNALLGKAQAPPRNLPRQKKPNSKGQVHHSYVQRPILNDPNEEDISIVSTITCGGAGQKALRNLLRNANMSKANSKKQKRNSALLKGAEHCKQPKRKNSSANYDSEGVASFSCGSNDGNCKKDGSNNDGNCKKDCSNSDGNCKEDGSTNDGNCKKDRSNNETENDEFKEETMSYQESISTAGPGAVALDTLCQMAFQPSANVHDKESASLNGSANVKNRGEESSSDEIEKEDEEDCLSLQESISTAGPGAKALDALCQMAFYQKKG